MLFVPHIMADSILMRFCSGTICQKSLQICPSMPETLNLVIPKSDIPRFVTGQEKRRALFFGQRTFKMRFYVSCSLS
jgi:hypothetical protein